MQTETDEVPLVHGCGVLNPLKPPTWTYRIDTVIAEDSCHGYLVRLICREYVGKLDRSGERDSWYETRWVSSRRLGTGNERADAIIDLSDSVPLFPANTETGWEKLFFQVNFCGGIEFQVYKAVLDLLRRRVRIGMPGSGGYRFSCREADEIKEYLTLNRVGPEYF